VLIKRISLNPNLDLPHITQTSPRGVGETSQRLRNEYVLIDGTNTLQRREGDAFILAPQKLSVGN
jgi:hypothetical protein